MADTRSKNPSNLLIDIKASHSSCPMDEAGNAPCEGRDTHVADMHVGTCSMPKPEVESVHQAVVWLSDRT